MKTMTKDEVEAQLRAVSDQLAPGTFTKIVSVDEDMLTVRFVSKSFLDMPLEDRFDLLDSLVETYAPKLYDTFGLSYQAIAR